MNDIFPDLLKVYYVSISVALVVGLTLGYSFCRALHGYGKASKQVDEMLHTTQGAAYDACQDEPTTDYDTEAVRKLLNSW